MKGSREPVRVIAAVAAGALVVLHVFHAFFQGDGGWWNEHDGLFGAIGDFFTLSFDDPILSAGLSDFMVLLVVFGVWMIAMLPAGSWSRPRTWLWLLSYALFPGFGALVYVAWLNPPGQSP